MPRSATAPVTTTRKVPELVDEDTRERLQQLYREAPQLNGKPPFEVDYPTYTPQQADEILRFSMTDPNFRNRITTVGQIQRHMRLMRTNRFVHFMPDGALCFDEGGYLLNGKHRMTAVAGQEKPIGFVVFKNVPRWMFKFMNTGKAWTLRDVFYAGNRRTNPQTPSAMKLAMRYEEFLFGLRKPEGWRQWGSIREDEHNDIDSFLGRREEMQDWYGVATKVQSKAKLAASSVMAFYFYQLLAWPEGADTLNEFCETLVTAGGWPGSPALTLREWGVECWARGDRIPAKRELHLLLLMRCFEQYVHRSKLSSIIWAYGNVMLPPYHPKGYETAITNVRFALEEMDRLPHKR